MAPFDGRPPNVLVPGGGELLGEAWMTGVLAGYEDATGADVRRCRRFVGTSAGSIVASSLVAGRSPRRPGRPRPMPSAQSDGPSQGPASLALHACDPASERTSHGLGLVGDCDQLEVGVGERHDPVGGAVPGVAAALDGCNP